jgi:hybrid polyketide synthase/nonribosomal peptide synthetase ACE1
MAQVSEALSEFLVSGLQLAVVVLDDTPLDDMTLDTLLKVTKPKVDGSLHINKVLKDAPLDFFVFFSSVSSVLGFPGQSNYAAANVFMISLAEQRRRRGLAASVINISAILGVGYIAQHGFNFRGREGPDLMSEQDFHQLFGEAVLSGQPGTEEPIELTMGLPLMDKSDMAVLPDWATDPRFSHLIRNRESRVAADVHSRTTVSLKIRLGQVRTRSEMFKMIQTELSPKLASLYEVDASHFESKDASTIRLDEIGTDSLIATEIRGWFMRTLQVNITVLQILGGASLGDLIEVAVASLSPPSLGTNTAEDEAMQKTSELVTSSRDPTYTQDMSVSSSAEATPEAPEGFDMEDLHPEVQSIDSTSESFVEIQSQDDKDSSYTGTAMQSETTLALAPAQTMFWLASMLQDSTSLHHTALYRLKGALRAKDLQIAIERVLQRHEILRTRFSEHKGVPVQTVMSTSFSRQEYRMINDEKESTSAYDELCSYQFDVAEGETTKLAILSLNSTTHFLAMAGHNLVLDGWSFRAVLKDLEQQYVAVSAAGLGVDTSAAPAYQFTDHCAAQQARQLMGDQHDAELSFWRKELSAIPEELPILRFSKAKRRPVLAQYENERVDLTLGPKVTSQIQLLCRRLKITPFVFYLTVFRILIFRHTHAEDFCLGIADANRTSDELVDVIGVLVNLLPLRFTTQATSRFEELVKETREKTHTALSNSNIPFQVLLDKLNITRSASSSPVFQAFMDYRMDQKGQQSFADCDIDLVSYQASKVAYDVTLDIIDGSSCQVMVIVRGDMYSKRDAELLAHSYERLVKAFVAQPKSRVGVQELFAPAITQQALKFGRGPSAPVFWTKTIIHRIDEAISVNSQAPAVCLADKVMTYMELWQAVHAIAGALLTAGIGPASRVAVLQKSTPLWVASIVAVMRVGAVYVALDRANTIQRLAHIVEDCEPAAYLVDEALTTDQAAMIRNVAKPGSIIDLSSLDTVNNRSHSSANMATPDAIAVLLYTSGSTGTPKGVSLRHSGMRNWLEHTNDIFDISGEKVLQQSAPGFDMSLIQVFTALCHGGCIQLVPEDFRGDARAIVDLICSQGVTYTFCCTSELAAWLRYGDLNKVSRCSWRRAITGGEPGVGALLPILSSLENSPRLFHAYGPTETTWTATTMELRYKDEEPDSLSTSDNIAVGFPLPNYTVCILDDAMKPVPVGAQGEVYIGGPGIAVGYLNSPGLTAERFVPNFLATSRDVACGWNTLHRTGDLGWWREDGALVLGGRIDGDTQVKIRGIRMDLCEIETAIVKASKGHISEAVVSLRKARSEDESPEAAPFLVAHVVMLDSTTSHGSNNNVDTDELIETLTSQLHLPRYMCPAVIIPLQQMPMTISGKLDRRAIAKLELPSKMSLKQDLPLTSTEMELKKIWESVIPPQATQMHNIGSFTDFFHVGGTSLLLLGVRAQIESRFGIQVPLGDLFTSSTLVAMARRVTEARRGDSNTTVSLIDWETETEVPRHLAHPSGHLAHQARRLRTTSSPRVVVLTGCTGYLGRALLEALLADDRIECIHCIAIRRNDQVRDIQSLGPRVLPYKGDLSLPRLGLSKQQEDMIFSEADAIIHNGADVSYLKTYNSLRESNVASTKVLAEMALARYIPIHYISSGSACSFDTTLSSVGPRSMVDHPPPVTGLHGYGSSKWASEVFLEKLHAAHPAWPIWIHRPANIERSGVPDMDLVHNIRHYSAILRAVPHIGSSVSGHITIVPLQDVVKGIKEAVSRGSPKMTRPAFGMGVTFLHHVGETTLSLDDLRS